MKNNYIRLEGKVTDSFIKLKALSLHADPNQINSPDQNYYRNSSCSHPGSDILIQQEQMYLVR